MADIFDVVADSTRRDLLQVLLDRYTEFDTPPGRSHAGEISVGEIVEKLGLSQPTVSKHLKVLRDHDLVTVREVGQHRFYTLDTSRLEELEDWLIPFLSADFDGRAAGETTGGSPGFAAWSGVQLPEPLRRAAETLQHPTEAGAAIGRRAAEASVRLQEAQHDLGRRLISPIKKKLSGRDEK